MYSRTDGRDALLLPLMFRSALSGAWIVKAGNAGLDMFLPMIISIKSRRKPSIQKKKQRNICLELVQIVV